MAMYEEPIFGRNKISHLGVDELDMNILGDPCPLPTAESGGYDKDVVRVKLHQRKLGWWAFFFFGVPIY